ncbi:OB-fold domain-containing protein [Nocardioides sp. zg-536]|uniref:OB-fold domain-containing protein n=1 Tax=Nocardioides faecalis TaxID=2803858 RepID=A0A938XZV6_9ACTN|nr:OB-fold domain-containing protein [Nocardioides faecalis]MBM9459557.1 OB-fold domain-containing protein [Nocardioides faecalis]QVI58089.1 OB-fold domain-containing protein [Nocardioides faecalis]
MTAPSVSPVIAGWFSTGEEPHLLASRCTRCSNVVFPPVAGGAGTDTGNDAGNAGAFFCSNPACDGTEHESVELSRRGTVWSYTDAQYQPPPPYVPRGETYEPFALAAVELPEGIVVLGQVADGYGVADLRVGAQVELVVETLNVDETGERTIYRWKPVAEEGEA